jgi:hypothetical protein
MKFNKRSGSDLDKLMSKITNVSVMTEEEEADEFLKKIKKMKASSPLKVSKKTTTISKVSKPKTTNKDIKNLLDQAWDALETKELVSKMSNMKMKK